MPQVPHPEREYSSQALLGVAVPQANPVVEPEFNALAPDGVGVIATRLQGSRTDSGNRLVQYLQNLGTSVEAFDTAKPDALAFACTGTSYLVGRDEERRQADRFSNQFGYPVVLATDAILAALAELGAKRIALLAPYPTFLVEASVTYWKAAGLDVVSHASKQMDPSDTRAVYRIRVPQVMEAIEQLQTDKADAILLSGTGMPTLRVIPELARRTGKPVLSSNLALMWRSLKLAGASFPAPRRELGESLVGGWVERGARL